MARVTPPSWRLESTGAPATAAAAPASSTASPTASPTASSTATSSTGAATETAEPEQLRVDVEDEGVRQRGRGASQDASRRRGRSRVGSDGSLYSLGSPSKERVRKESVGALQPREEYYEGRFGVGGYLLVFPRVTLRLRIRECVVLPGLSRSNALRAACISLMRTRWFDAAVLLVIAINACMMCLYDPVDHALGISNAFNDALARSEWVFQVFFTCEMLVKWLAVGLLQAPSGYLRDGWNVLDLCIVVLGWVPLIALLVTGSSAGSVFAVFRTARVLRPLRTLGFFPRLRVLVRTILISAREISAVLLMCLCILLLFSLIAVALFKGKLRQRCGEQVRGADGQLAWVVPTAEAVQFCSNGLHGRQCGAGLSCIVAGANPLNRLWSFDNVGVALLTIVQVITLESWSLIMYAIFDTTYQILGVYFILLILFGSFFMVNLIISALAVTYQRVREADVRGAEAEQDRVSFIEKLTARAELRAALNDRFNQLPLDKRIRHMEMRLMYSFEHYSGSPLYSIVSQDDFDKYWERNHELYPDWRRRYARHLARSGAPSIIYPGPRPGPSAAAAAAAAATASSPAVPAAAASAAAPTAAAPAGATEDGSTILRFEQLASSSRGGGVEWAARAVGARPLLPPAVNRQKSTGSSHSNPSSAADAAGLFQEPMTALSQMYSQIDREERAERAKALSEAGLEGSDLADFEDAIEQDGSAEEAEVAVTVSQAAGASGATGTSGASGAGAGAASAPMQARVAHAPPALSKQASWMSELTQSTAPSPAPSRRRREPLGARPDAPRWRRWLWTNVVSRIWFNSLLTGVILLNTAILASAHFLQPEWLSHVQDVSNSVFLSIYSVELALRLCAMGLVSFLHDGFCLFDLLIVTMGYIELALPGNSFSGVFRMLRLLRLVKLAKLWTSLNNLVLSLDATLRQVVPFLVFFSIFLFVFTISGLHLIGGKLQVPLNLPVPLYFSAADMQPVQDPAVPPAVNPDFDCTDAAGRFLRRLNNGTLVWFCPPRTNYDSFLWALVTTFQIVSREAWNDIMSLVVSQTGSLAYAAYFYVLTLFGSYVVVGFFVAILIDSFLDQHRKREADRKAERLGRLVGVGGGGGDRADGGELRGDGVISPATPIAPDSGPTPVRAAGTPDAATASPPAGPSDIEMVDSRSSAISALRAQQSTKNLKKVVAALSRSASAQGYDLTRDQIAETAAFSHNSLFVVPPTSQLRLWAAWLVTRSWFEALTLITILTSCVLLAVDAPRADINRQALWVCTVVITAIFTAEAALKILAYGFVRGPVSYLRSGWNVLDLFVVVISVLDLALPAGDAHALAGLRAARALVPLKSVSKFKSLRTVVRSFTLAFIPCVQVMLVCAVFYLIFSIISVNLFMGALKGCYECPLVVNASNHCARSYPHSANASWPPQRNCFPYTASDGGSGVEGCSPDNTCSGTDASGQVEYRWSDPTYDSTTFLTLAAQPYSFDNVLAAFLVLFEQSTLEIWYQPMWAATDIAGVGLNPVRGSNDLASLFWLVFLLVMQYFLLQVFVAVLIDTYFLSSEEAEGVAFMTEEQRRWVEYNKKALTRPFRPHRKLGRPAGCIRGPIYDFVTLDVFDKAVLAVIACNTLFLLTDHYDRSPTYDAVAVGLELAFGVVYIAEAALKIVGFGPRAYFGDRSNLFDFCIVLAVIAGFISVLAEPSGSSGSADILSALQALRALRILRLMERVPVLRPLVGTLITTLWPLVNIAGLVFLTIFVYAILGMQLFGQLDPTDPATDYQFLGAHVNFLTFPNAFYALFVMSTGESWNAIGRELRNYSASAPYFVLSFVFIVQLFLLSLFVAVILAAFTNQFESKAARGGVKQTLDDAALLNYNTTWNMLHMDYVAGLRRQVAHERKRALGERRASATLGLAQRRASAAGAGSSAKLEELERQLRDALRHPYFLPAASFAELMLRLKAPLGFRKRSRKARFTYADVLRYVQDGHVPVTEGSQIHFHATLRALIDINVLQNKVPEEVEQLLQLKLASYARPAVARADQPSEEDDDDTSLMSILAREQIRRLIRRHSLMWRMRQLKKNGASEDTIRQFLATYDAVYGDGGQPRRSDLRLGAQLASFSPGSARQAFVDRMRSMRSFTKR